MDGHGDYSPLERPRLLEGGSGGNGGSGSSGSGGNHPQSVAEYAARAATPTTMTPLAQYHNRYGLPSTMPGSNFALMSSLLSGAHSSDSRKTLLPDIQHYWSAPAESFPRYLMTGGIYSPYPPLFPGTAESLSLLGAGVACVAGGATTGAGPSQPYHLAHYQRLLEMQKEAYLASVSAAASHHTAIYGISTNTLPPFLDQTAVSSHSATPLSLVKQEPKEQSFTERASKQGERRTIPFKVDVDPNRESRETFSSPLSASPGNSLSAQLREPKLSPSLSLNVSGKWDKKAGNSSTPRGNNHGLHSIQKSFTDTSVNSSSIPKSGNRPNRATPPASSVHLTRSTNNSNTAYSSSSKKSGSKSSVSTSKQLLISASTTNSPNISSSPPVFLPESPVVSVPTQAAAPIALATVQHDGVILSALASPSSAAATSVSTKPVILKQQACKRNRTAAVVADLMVAEKSASEVNTSSRLSDGLVGPTLTRAHRTSVSHYNGDVNGDINNSCGTSNRKGVDTFDQREDSKQLNDDSADIVVDSTENDDIAATTTFKSAALTKSDNDRAVEETIERVASAADSDIESDQDNVTSQSRADIDISDASLLCVTRTETGTRTVYAKTQPVFSVAVSGNIPVGIAVAQIRPHHTQQIRESQAPENLTRDNRHIHTSISTKTLTTATASLAAPAAALAPSLVVSGPTINQSPWLQQMPFPLHPAMNSSGTTFDPSFPITAPSGFKLAHDSLTGQLFLIPNGDFVEQGGVWPSPTFVKPPETGSTHYQTTLNPPTVTINSEKREGRPTTERPPEKSTSPANTSGKIIPAPETISKEKLEFTREDEKHHVLAQPILGGSSKTAFQGLIPPATAATILVNPVTSVNSTSPVVLVKVERPTVESRGCSPIHFEDVSSPLSILSALSCLTSEKPPTCTVGVQTCDSLMKLNWKRKSSSQKFLLHDQAVQTSHADFPAFNPLSVHCPDLDSVDPLTRSLEEKTHSERGSYNPFTDPQILQAADGLELLSTLAEKRPKCSALDDPKRIFPSPSDSFKSDSASIVAFEDTLSPGDTELKSGQCTPRREVRRDLSPKWSLLKKEPQTVSEFGDFKTPSEIEIPDDSDVRVKLAEVQRQYKEKQKELAKLQIKKTEESKQSKRGPGRPPKKKTPTKKSDDESSSSSSKTKDHQQPQKKIRPVEELVDRVFRKLPPVIKPSKGSRSIHYVKSKTGPFFRRKSASSSVKRNKDLFGFDESNWPSFSERKHQEKVKGSGSISRKSKSRHRPNPSHGEDSKQSHDVGNIFSNMESFGGEYVENTGQPQGYIQRRDHLPKHFSQKHEKLSSLAPGTVVIKTEHCSTSSHQESGLGLLAKFALNTSVATVSSLTASASSTTPVSGSCIPTSAVSSFSSSTSNPIISSSNNNNNNSGGGLYSSYSSVYNTSSTGSGGHTSGITFGSMSNLMSSATASLMSFTRSSLVVSSPNSATPPATSTSVVTSPAATATTTASQPVSTAISSTSPTSVTTLISLFPSPESQQQTITEETSSDANCGTISCSSTVSCGTVNSVINSTTNCSSTVNSVINNTTTWCSSLSSSPLLCSTSNARDTSTPKRKIEEDSDTDTSDTSPNKKRKPGRPRKINPDKSSGGTETIWAKKSSNIGLLQELSPSQPKEGDCKKLDASVLKPLFLDEEWTRRRSERIFLNEPSPQPSPALSPVPRGEPVWKLSNFMPKSKKLLDVNKSIKEAGLDKDSPDPEKDQQPSSSLAPTNTPVLASSSSVAVKTEGKESISWTAAKTIEISMLKLEDPEIIKLEDITLTLSLSPLAEKAKKYSKAEDSEKKNKVKKKVKKDEAPPITPSVPPVTPSAPPITPSAPPPLATLEMKEKRAEENSKIKLQKAKSLHDLTQRVKKKFSKAAIKKQDDHQMKKLSKTEKKKRRISTDSSDTDNLPLVTYRINPPTPEPRSCRLQQSDLREGLKVLYLIDGLFHEGTVKALQPPDVYGVLTAGQRGNRPHILCLEEILKWAVLDVKPGSLRYLTEGTRVCAFWSQQFSCLYPGTVAKSSPVSNGKKVIVSVEFDDGDNGRIELDHIRLLPSDFPIVEYEPDPLEALPRRKQRTTSDASDRRKSVDTEARSSKHSKEDEDVAEEDDDNSSKDDADSDNPGTSIKREVWRWDGKSTKRPGLKGKAKKVFYKAVNRGKETIRVGDSAIFVSKERVNCPYIGRIGSLWEGWNGQMMVKVQWYYHPEETESNKKLTDPRNALFESQHEDENDIQTIAHKCEVLSFAQYKKRLSNLTKKGKSLKPNVFFVAGFYDPAAKDVTFHTGVS